MTAKLHDEGETWVLEKTLAQTLYFGLYKNVSALSESAVLADITEPSSYGYGRKTLTGGSWVINDDEGLYAEQTLLAEGGNWGDIAGYFIATSPDNSGKLVASEHFTSPYTVNDGKGIKIIPKFKCS